MGDWSDEELSDFIAAAAIRLQELFPALSEKDALDFAIAALPPVSVWEGVVELVTEDGRTLSVPLRDFDPYGAGEALEEHRRSRTRT